VKFVYLAIAIVSEVIGTIALKASEGFSKPIPSLIVAAGYGTAFYFLSLCLDMWGSLMQSGRALESSW
jgi:small multidrug resistance pump